MKNLPKVEKPAAFLVKNGILFEINRQVLHPLGMEIALTCDEGGELVRLEIFDNRDDPSPIHFPSDAFEEGRQKYERYMAEHGRRNVQKRRRLGMGTQTGPNLPHHIHDGPEPGAAAEKNKEK